MRLSPRGPSIHHQRASYSSSSRSLTLTAALADARVSCAAEDAGVVCRYWRPVMRNKMAWCFGFLLVTVVAGAQTSEPEFLVRANRMEKSEGRMLATGHVEFKLGSTLITADEVTIQWVPGGGDQF